MGTEQVGLDDQRRPRFAEVTLQGYGHQVAPAHAVFSAGLEGQTWLQVQLGTTLDEPSGAALAGIGLAMVVIMVAKATRR